MIFFLIMKIATNERINNPTAEIENVIRFPKGITPVFGSFGAASCMTGTTTVARARSLTVKPLASPRAMTVFKVVSVSFVLHV